MGIGNVRRHAMAVLVAVVVLWAGGVFAAADEAKRYYNQGMQQASQGKYEEAAESLRKAIEIRPKYEEALLELAQLYDRQRAVGKAVTVYGQLLSLRPDHQEALYAL